MRVTFINNIRTFSGVFLSHLFPLMDMVHKEKHVINFITLYRGELNKKVVDIVNGDICEFRLRTLFRVINIVHASDLVICRNYWATFLFLCIKGIVGGTFRVHADLRGVVPREMLRYKPFPLNYIYFIIMKWMEKVILALGTSISCVSRPFRDYLIQNGCDSSKIKVVPNGIYPSKNYFDSHIRNEMRKKLNIDDQLVFVYCGSVKGWYCHEEMLRLFKGIHNANKNTWLLILSPSKARFHGLCNKVAVSNYSIYSLKPHEVPSYLMAADYAFIGLRDDSVTCFSSPITFAEYLAAGNQVIISKNIGDSSRFVEEHNAGFVIDVSNPNEVVPYVLDEVPLNEKQRISHLATRYWNKMIIYTELLHSLGL